MRYEASYAWVVCSLLGVLIDAFIQWNDASMEPALWQQLCLPWLQANVDVDVQKCKEHDKPAKPGKKGIKMKKERRRQKGEAEPWRDFFIANVYWESNLPVKLLRRHENEVMHSHQFLGTTVCTRPHL